MSSKIYNGVYKFGDYEWEGNFVPPTVDLFLSWAKAFMKHPLYKNFEVLGIGSFFEDFNTDRKIGEIDIKIFGDRPEEEIKTLLWFGFDEGLKRNINIDILWCEKKLSFNSDSITLEDLHNPDRVCLYKKPFREVYYNGRLSWDIKARPTKSGIWEYQRNMLEQKHFEKEYKITGPITTDGAVPTLEYWLEHFCQD